jgi:hypothetical protein
MECVSAGKNSKFHWKANASVGKPPALITAQFVNWAGSCFWTQRHGFFAVGRFANDFYFGMRFQPQLTSRDSFSSMIG